MTATHPYEVPEIIFWTSQHIRDTILENDRLVHEVWDKMADNIDTSPKELFRRTELKAAMRLMSDGLPVKTTR